MEMLPNYAWESPPEIDWDELDIVDAELADTVARDTPLVLSAALRLLSDDAVAATMVAATINIRQSAQESGGAFVKRIVRSWLEEMGR